MDYATFYILYVTFLAILWYSWETKKLRLINEKAFYEERFNKLLDTFSFTHSLIQYNINGWVKANDLSPHEPVRLFGDDVLKKVYQKLEAIYKSQDNVKDEQYRCIKTFDTFFRNHLREYSHLQMFFNAFDNILKYLDKIQKKYPEEIDYYKSRFQSLISSYSVSVLFYYGIGGHCPTLNLIDVKFKIFYDIITPNDIMKDEHYDLYQQFNSPPDEDEGESEI